MLWLAALSQALFRFGDCVAEDDFFLGARKNINAPHRAIHDWFDAEEDGHASTWPATVDKARGLLAEEAEAGVASGIAVKSNSSEPRRLGAIYKDGKVQVVIKVTIFGHLGVRPAANEAEYAERKKKARHNMLLTTLRAMATTPGGKRRSDTELEVGWDDDYPPEVTIETVEPLQEDTDLVLIEGTPMEEDQGSLLKRTHIYIKLHHQDAVMGMRLFENIGDLLNDGRDPEALMMGYLRALGKADWYPLEGLQVAAKLVDKKRILNSVIHINAYVKELSGRCIFKEADKQVEKGDYTEESSCTTANFCWQSKKCYEPKPVIPGAHVRVSTDGCKKLEWQSSLETDENLCKRVLLRVLAITDNVIKLAVVDTIDSGPDKGKIVYVEKPESMEADRFRKDYLKDLKEEDQMMPRSKKHVYISRQVSEGVLFLPPCPENSERCNDQMKKDKRSRTCTNDESLKEGYKCKCAYGYAGNLTLPTGFRVDEGATEITYGGKREWQAMPMCVKMCKNVFESMTNKYKVEGDCDTCIPGENLKDPCTCKVTCAGELTWHGGAKEGLQTCEHIDGQSVFSSMPVCLKKQDFGEGTPVCDKIESTDEMVVTGCSGCSAGQSSTDCPCNIICAADGYLLAEDSPDPGDFVCEAKNATLAKDSQCEEIEDSHSCLKAAGPIAGGNQKVACCWRQDGFANDKQCVPKGSEYIRLDSLPDRCASLQEGAYPPLPVCEKTCPNIFRTYEGIRESGSLDACDMCIKSKPEACQCAVHCDEDAGYSRVGGAEEGFRSCSADGEHEGWNLASPICMKHARGEFVKGKTLAEETLQMSVGTNGVKPDVSALTKGMLVVTQDRIVAFEGEDYPTCSSSGGVNPCNYERMTATSYIDTATTYVEKLSATDVESPSDTPKEEVAEGDIDERDALGQKDKMVCVLLSGCRNHECEDISETWLLCSDNGETIDRLDAMMTKIYCERNQLEERLGPAIVQASQEARNLPPPTDRDETPKSFSPFVLLGQPDEFGQDELRRIEEAFRVRVSPFRPGANSRSGAAFYFSGDKRYMAKRIRDWELETFWLAVRDGKYASMLQTGSVMNPHYLGFIREDVHQPSCWIVMKTEGLPESVKDIIEEEKDPILGKSADFFMDVKPRPMVSDRMKMAQRSIRLHAYKNGRNGPSSSWVDSTKSQQNWKKLETHIEQDFDFLEENKLVDYSLLMYGSVFPQPNFTQERKLTQEMRSLDNCVLDCPKGTAGSQRRLVDVTSYVRRYDNKVPYKNAHYKCCCATMSSWETAVARSPCVLVNMEAPSQKWGIVRDRTGCGNLIKGKWHIYTSIEKNPFLGGKCVVGAGLWGNRGSLKLKGGPMFADPEQAFSLYVPDFKPVCSIFCVSVLDYLLPLNLRNVIENLLLAPWYRQRKWSGYGEKMKSLMRCVAAAPLGSSLGSSAIAGNLRSMIYETANLVTPDNFSDSDVGNGTRAYVPDELASNADELQSAAKCEDFTEVFETGVERFPDLLISDMKVDLRHESPREKVFLDSAAELK